MSIIFFVIQERTSFSGFPLHQSMKMCRWWVSVIYTHFMYEFLMMLAQRFDACPVLSCPYVTQPVWGIMYNGWDIWNKKRPIGSRKSGTTLEKPYLFCQLKKTNKQNNVMETHNQKLMHIDETKLWKFKFWTSKYSFGEEVHVSPDEQTEIVFEPIWKKKKNHRRLTRTWVLFIKAEEPHKSLCLAFEGTQTEVTQSENSAALKRHNFIPLVITVIQGSGAWSYIVQFPLSNQQCCIQVTWEKQLLWYWYRNL